MQGKKILIADDEPKIVKLLADLLRREGYTVFTAGDGLQLLKEFRDKKPDLVILDVMMPKLDGFSACRSIREESNVPIIFLTAKSDSLDRIMGLTLGSDDYLTKPFDSTELLLRIKAILRRVSANSGQHPDEIIIAPGITINRTARVVERDGREIELTPKEFDLLWLLASHPAQVFTRDQLLYQIWNTEYTGDTGVVTTLVKRLREKIESDAANPHYIKTIRGVGYKFGPKPC